MISQLQSWSALLGDDQASWTPSGCGLVDEPLLTYKASQVQSLTSPLVGLAVGEM